MYNWTKVFLCMHTGAVYHTTNKKYEANCFTMKVIKCFLTDLPSQYKSTGDCHKDWMNKSKRNILGIVIIDITPIQWINERASSKRVTYIYFIWKILNQEFIINSMEKSLSWEANSPTANQEITPFYRTQRFITMFTMACQGSLSWTRW